MKKSVKSWRMTRDHHVLKQEVTTNSATVPIVVSVLDQISMVSGMLYAGTDLINALLSTNLSVLSEAVCFYWYGNQCNLKVLPQAMSSFIHSTIIYSAEILKVLTFQNITLI